MCHAPRGDQRPARTPLSHPSTCRVRRFPPPGSRECFRGRRWLEECPSRVTCVPGSHLRRAPAEYRLGWSRGVRTRREATSTSARTPIPAAPPSPRPRPPGDCHAAVVERGYQGGGAPDGAAPLHPRSVGSMRPVRQRQRGTARAMKGDRVEIVIDAGSGTTRTYEITATRARAARSRSRTPAASSRSARSPAAAAPCAPPASWPTGYSPSSSTPPPTPRSPTRSPPPCAPPEPDARQTPFTMSVSSGPSH